MKPAIRESNVNELRIIVTGASSGIGAALVRELSSHHKLLITGRSSERLKDVTAQLPPTAREVASLAGDIVNPEFRAQLVQEAVRRFDGIDVVINCAGLGATGYFDVDGPHHLRTMLELNLIAPIELIRAALPELRRSTQAMIVNVASVVGRRGVPGYSDYCATKFGLCGWSEAVRAELAPFRIHMLLVCPGATATAANSNLLEDRLNVAMKTNKQMSAQECAVGISHAISAKKNELVLSGGGRFLVLLNRWFPRLADRMLALKIR